jgi:hypothetical protein
VFSRRAAPPTTIAAISFKRHRSAPRDLSNAAKHRDARVVTHSDYETWVMDDTVSLASSRNALSDDTARKVLAREPSDISIVSEVTWFRDLWSIGDQHLKR